MMGDSVWITLLGFASAALLCLCGLPQMIAALKDKERRLGIAWGMLVMWFLGEVLGLVYYLIKLGMDMPTIINYGTNTILVGVLIGLYLKQKREIKNATEQIY